MLATGRALGARRWVAEAQAGLGKSALGQEDVPEALARFEEALALFRDEGDTRGVANMLLNIGRAMLGRGALAVADPHFRESLALYRQLGDPMGMIYALLHQGVIAIAAQDVARVSELGGEALRLAWASEFAVMVGYSLGMLATGSIMRGEAGRGVRLFGAAARIFGELGLSMQPPEQARTDRWLQVARGRLEPAAFAAAWAAGLRLPREAAVAEALALPLEERSLPWA